MDYDGWVVIGSKLDTKDFQKQLKDQEGKLREYEKEAEKLTTQKSKMEVDISDGEVAIEVYKKMAEEELKTIKSEELRNEIIKQNAQNVEVMNAGLQAMKDEYEDINKKLEANASKQEIIKNEITETTKQLKQTSTYNDIIGKVDDIGKSVKKVAKDVISWGLAIFGIRGAFNFIRSSMSTLSQYNEGIKTDIEYIRFALASSMQRVIENLIQLMYKLLVYVAYLAKAWFNVDLFANASVKAFNKANKSASALRKTLFGFDEMNILNDNGSIGALGALPSMDLSNWEGVEIPEWLVWIKDHGDLIKLILEAIAAAILAIKFNLGLIGLAGVVVVIEGIVKLIKDLKEYLEDKTWSNFADILKDIGEILIGFGIIFGLTTPLGQILAVIGLIVIAVGDLINNIEKLKTFIDDPSWSNFVALEHQALGSAGLIGVAIRELIGLNKELAKETDGLKDAEQRLEDQRRKVNDATDSYIRAVDNANEKTKALKEIIEKYGISEQELNEIIEIGTDDYAKLNDQQKEIFKAYNNNKIAQDKLTTATQNLNKEKKQQKKDEFDVELQTLRTAGAYDEYKQKIMQAMKDGSISTEEARDRIKDAMVGMDAQSKETFLKDIPDNIKSGLEPSKFQTAFEKFKRAWNDFILRLNTNIHVTASGSYSAGQGRGFAKGGIAYYEPIKLASGAIINQPNRGVPITQARGGEAGAEGILPLTDEQQMAILGRKIGENVVINFTNINKMNSRTISRELKTFNNESDFAFNN